MNAIAPPDTQTVRLRSRFAYVALLWLVLGTGLAMGLHFAVAMEAGYDPLTEFLGSILVAPVFALIGLPYLLAGPTAPTVVEGIAFFLGLTALVAMTVAVLRARERKAFIRMALEYALIVGTALFGYYRFACYWELHGA